MKERAFVVRDEKLMKLLDRLIEIWGYDGIEEIEIVAVIDTENEHSDDA
jgi:hypothetical protein